MVDIYKRIILDFEAIYQQRKYITDFEVFIKESRLEDFYAISRETIFVSTIHKAKGKEFDNFFLLLENFEICKEEQKRQLYVAMTRAKSNLTIHLSGRYLNRIQGKNVKVVEDRGQYELPTKLAMQLNHRDVWLDYFIARQYIIESLKSGDILHYKGGEFLTDKGQSVFRFSKRFNEQLERIQKNGFELLKLTSLFFGAKKQRNRR